MRNAEAWIGDVADACEGFVPKRKEKGERLDEETAGACGCRGEGRTLLEFVYGEEGNGEEAKRLVRDVEAFRKGKRGGSEWEGRKERLDERVREELGRVLEWCVMKFGKETWVDATSAWVKNSEKVQKMSDDMVSGGKGYREF